MSAWIVKTLFICFIAIIVTGCKLVVMVPSGGYLESLSNTRDCSSKNLCEFEMNADDFSEAFTAIAKPGYVFSGWQPGSRFLCGGSTNSTCDISNQGLGAVAAVVLEIIASGELYYAMPRFEFVGFDTDGDGIKDHIDDDDDNDGILDIYDVCPLNQDLGCGVSTITVGNDEWYQPSLLIGYSWDDLRAICDPRPCVGTLSGGEDITGWYWAYAREVNALFNYYIGAPEVEDVNRIYKEMNSYWAPAFLNDFRFTETIGEAPNDIYYSVRGLTNQTTGLFPQRAYQGVLNMITPRPSSNNDYVYTGSSVPLSYPNDGMGVWLYRPL